MNLQKLSLGQSKPADGATTVGDVDFPQIICLLSFDGGSNGSTTLTDLSNNNHTVNAESGAQISTAQSKWGTSSLFLDGTNDYVELNSIASQLSSASVCTIEGWWKLPDSSDAGILFAINTNGGGNVLWANAHADSTIKFHGGGSSSTISISPVNIRDGNWHHVAVTFDGTDYDLYVDGNRYHQNFTQTTAISSDDKIQIGMEYDSGTKGDYLQLYCNDFRVSKTRRYTDSTYTVPTAAFLTSAGDVNKHIVVNSDADGVAIGTGGINQARISKAWVFIDGENAAASMIQGSYNVSSMTDNAVGKYQINFSTAMSDTNYSAVGSYGGDGDYANTVGTVRFDGALSTAHAKIGTAYTYDNARYFYDYPKVYAQFFGN